MANPENTLTIVLTTIGAASPRHASASQQLADALFAAHPAVSLSQVHLTDESEITAIIESTYASSPVSNLEQTQSSNGDSVHGNGSNALLIVSREATGDKRPTPDQSLQGFQSVQKVQSLQTELVAAAKSAYLPVLVLLIGDPETSTSSASDALQRTLTSAKANKLAKTKYHTLVIRDVYRTHDIALITRQCFSQLNLALTDDSALAHYPVAPQKLGGTVTIDQQILAKTITNAIPNWELRTLFDKAISSGQDTSEITRSFRFSSFQSAIRYMHQVAPACDVANHHPRWENNWRTLQVWLTTWDAERQITNRDLQLARYFNHVYTEFGYAD